MPNYAIPGLGLDPGPFRAALPGLSQASRLMFGQDMPAGYEYWLSFMNPSFNQDQALRRLYETLNTRYRASVASQRSPIDQQWIEYLASVNPAQEYAALPRDIRGEQPNRFMRPARYLPF